MSLRSDLARARFTETRVLGRAFTLEALLALFRRGVLSRRRAADGGRPVRFVGDRADDTPGGAYGLAGWDVGATALEPEAAGDGFARTLERAGTVLIGISAAGRAVLGDEVRAGKRARGGGAGACGGGRG